MTLINFNLVRILKEDGSPCQLLELGRIVVKLPLPPGVMSCLYKAPERFINTYFNNFIVKLYKF